MHGFKSLDLLTDDLATVGDFGVTKNDEHLLAGGFDAVIVLAEDLDDFLVTGLDGNVGLSLVGVSDGFGHDGIEGLTSSEPQSGVTSDVVTSGSTRGNGGGSVGAIENDTHAEASCGGVGCHGSVARPRADGFDETDQTVGVTAESEVHRGSTFNQEDDIDGGALNVTRVLALIISPDALRKFGAIARSVHVAALQNFAASRVAASGLNPLASGGVEVAASFSGEEILVVTSASGGHARGRRDCNVPGAVKVEVAIAFRGIAGALVHFAAAEGDVGVPHALGVLKAQELVLGDDGARVELAVGTVEPFTAPVVCAGGDVGVRA